MLSDPHNPVFQLAVQFVNQTARPIFLTGRAGTGKTTFLKFIRENSFKKMAVVAPTGVAAINAGGTTLHSFFQLPFGPFVPTPQYGWNPEGPGFSDPNSLFKNIRFNASKRELLQELELLIIDEISMVRADMLDAVDAVLRHFRQQPLAPFGGLQVLYIGDLYQLPPVVSKEEWNLLQHHYASPFFFDAHVTRQSPPVYLELNKIYRQNEAEFIRLLNNIRNNRMEPEDLEKLHDYYQPEFIPSKRDNYITLTSHNVKADSINREELDKLKGRSVAFEASVTGEFNDKAFPAEKTLTLKEGAQVMLIKNDKGETRRYYNGKIGTVKKIADDRLTLVFPDEPDELVLEKETWKNIRYQYNKELDQVEEEELGTFRQYPIRLAWAITIHKSQGLTFEKAVIDAGASFAPGQVYVALSRLTKLEGLVLRSRIQSNSISTDPRVVAYMEAQLPEQLAEQQLEHEQLTYITDSLRRTFQWSRLVGQQQDHHAGYAHRQIPGKIAAIEWSKKCLDNVLAQQEVAQKFSRQLETLLPGAEADGYQQLQQRTTAAAAYFSRVLQEDIIDPLQQHIAEMRTSKKAKKYLQDLQTLKLVFTRKKQQVEDADKLVSGLQKGIDTTRLLSGLQEDRQSRQAAAEVEAEQEAGPKTSGKPQKGDTNRTTLRLYKEGTSITEIATLRNLTQSTVESHLASFIPTGEIDLKDLVPEHKIESILTAIKSIGGSSLGPIKSKLGEDYSFGEIRAVLTWSKFNTSSN
ncbi:MAG TPA: helix-turn-helix domain-containing protein [Puia sp.]|nr:helix-turn-helix domain-containing protein [Puia sp.]